MDNKTKTVMEISDKIFEIIEKMENMTQSDLQGCIEAQIMNAYEEGRGNSI